MLSLIHISAGVTSLASINFKDEDELMDSYTSKGMAVDDAYVQKVLPEKMAYNLEYIKEFGFFKDIKLMFKTVASIVK